MSTGTAEIMKIMTKINTGHQKWSSRSQYEDGFPYMTVTILFTKSRLCKSRFGKV